MRPTLKALAEQQIMLEAQQRQIDAIARIAGINVGPIKAQVKRRIAVLNRTADAENPAQPVPEPAPEAPEVTSDEALGEISTDAPAGGNTIDDVTDVGTTSETDVTPTATDDVTSVGTSLDETLTLEDQDVTRPVEGTTDARPTSETVIGGDVTAIDEVRTESFDDPIFPEEKVGNRTYAALRLARLRIQAGIERGDDLTLGEAIAKSAVSNEAIAAEIATLTKVRSVAQRQQPAPSTAQAPRAVPSMATAAAMGNQGGGVAQGSGVGGDVAAAVNDAIL
jgi:hypothetical protein